MTAYRDWVVELSNTTGTTAYALAGPPAGTSYFTFRQRFPDGNADTVYWAVNPTRTKWEKNRGGTLTFGTPDSLSRNVVESTNGDAPVSWVGDDLPLRIYVASDADAAEFAVTMGLATARPDVLSFGLWSDKDDGGAGIHTVNVYDGASDIRFGVVGTTDHSFFPSFVPRGYLAGLNTSNNGTTQLNITAGVAADSTNVAAINCAAGTLNTGVNGANGLDTGPLANNSSYSVFVIRNPNGTTAFLASLNATTPTMPTGYTLKRRIGGFRTNGATQIFGFIQDGDLFQYAVPELGLSATNPGTAAVTRSLILPGGVNLIAILQVGAQNMGSASSTYAYISDLATTDTAPGGSVGDTGNALNVAGGAAVQKTVKHVRTNTLAQVRSRMSYSDAGVTLTLTTLGWIDRRGRDA